MFGVRLVTAQRKPRDEGTEAQEKSLIFDGGQAEPQKPLVIVHLVPRPPPKAAELGTAAAGSPLLSVDGMLKGCRMFCLETFFWRENTREDLGDMAEHR